MANSQEAKMKHRMFLATLIVACLSVLPCQSQQPGPADKQTITNPPKPIPESLKQVVDGVSAFAKLNLYQPGVTKESDVHKDGWSAGDLFYRKVGILSMRSNGGVTQYTLGFLKLDADNPSAARLIQNGFAATDAFASVAPVQFTPSFQGTSVTQVCRLNFEKDVLKSVEWLLKE